MFRTSKKTYDVKHNPVDEDENQYFLTEKKTVRYIIWTSTS